MATQSFTKEFTIYEQDAQKLGTIITSLKKNVMKKDYSSKDIDKEDIRKFLGIK